MADRHDMITARHLSRRYGRIWAARSLDFDVPRGGVVGFLGPNGAGKTTTIRMIAGYLPPTSGAITVDGLDVRRHRRVVRQRIGYLPEATPLYPELRVVEYLRFRAKLFGIERSRRRAAIDRALTRCWLKDVRRRLIGQLSKGYRQRVGLAAAMLHEPPLLILDEPTVGLDPAQIREVRNLIRELAGQHTILLSTHILPEVELTCDRIIMMARGRIRLQGRIRDLLQAERKTASYIAETDAERAVDAIRRLEGVERVDVERLAGPWRRLTVAASRDAGDLQEAIYGAIVHHGALLRELRREGPTLEQLFVRVLSEAESEADAAAPPGDDPGTGRLGVEPLDDEGDAADDGADAPLRHPAVRDRAGEPPAQEASA